MDTDTAKKERDRQSMATTNRQEGTPRPETLFFEMSRPVESPEMLRGWVEWFQRLRIPCAIAKTRAGYTLWRTGKEAGRIRSKAPSTHTNFIYVSGLTPRELNHLKKRDREEDCESPSQLPDGFEDMPLAPWEESQEGLTADAAPLPAPG